MTKLRFVLLSLLSVLLLGISSFPFGMPKTNMESIRNYPITNVPSPDTPLRLRDAWLRFHRDNLCEKVDAAFLFHQSEMEVLVNIGDGKNHHRLFKMLEPLHNSYQVKLRTVKLQTERELMDIRNPPPSFLLNSKLTGYLRDSFLRDTNTINYSGRDFSTRSTPSIMFEQRMLMFARDTLDYNRKIRLYASHLPLLARAASDPDATPNLRKQALDVCRAHIKKLEKYTNKLNSNLVMVLPKASKKSKKAPQSEDPIMANASSVDIAVQLADEAEDLSRRVYRFIYPQSHTVEVADLLNPTILQSLKILQKTTAEFQNSIS